MYGENIGTLRNELATLLSQHRVNERIRRDLVRPRSPVEGARSQDEVRALIRRYRHTVLGWCHQAMVQGDPNPKAEYRGNNFDPPDRLRQTLARVLARNSEALPGLRELTTRQDVSVLETWRQAAKASALAEHDIDRGIGDGHLDHREWLTLVSDVADITKALLILDKRYRQLPGWETLRGARRLGRYVEDCTTHAQARFGKLDYNIDWRGWHPPNPEIAPDASPITHVLAAEHRLLNSLSSVPSMINLRHLITSQRELSHLAADIARDAAPAQATGFRARERTYAKLSKASRTAAGLAGTGAIATRHSADAVRHLATIDSAEFDDAHAFRNLEKLFRHVDNAICEAIEQGFTTRLYLVRRALPRIDATDGNLTHRAREIFDPLQHEGRTPLIAVARRHLRTDPVPMAAPGDAAIARVDFRASINRHRSHSNGMSR